MTDLPIPGIGRIVHYRLSEQDVASITTMRQQASILAGSLRIPARQGNPVSAGDAFPMMITKVWSPDPHVHTAVNGQVFLDGNDTLWVTSALVGEGPRTYSWPTRG